jgi:hypothetical protein
MRFSLDTARAQVTQHLRLELQQPARRARPRRHQRRRQRGAAADGRPAAGTSEDPAAFLALQKHLVLLEQFVQRVDGDVERLDRLDAVAREVVPGGIVGFGGFSGIAVILRAGLRLES